MILERLKNDVVIGDGGALFELERRGYLSAGPFTPEVSINHPEALLQLQIDFARAGAEVIQALTYYAHEEKLKTVGLDGALVSINEAAVKIANQAAKEYGALVAGNLSNTWVFDPADPSSYVETRRQFDRQIEYQAIHGVDFFIAETIEYLGEAKIALEAIQDSGKPSMITLGFKYSDSTLDGYSLEEAYKELEGAGADILGVNCFRDPERMLPLGIRVKNAVSCHVALQPVAYRCSDERPYFQVQKFKDRFAFPLELDPFVLTRFEMADYARKAKDSGISYIGGCCGTGPHHIRSMAEALGRVTPNSIYSPRIDLHPVIGDEKNIKERDKRILCEMRHGEAICHFSEKQNKDK